MFDHFIKAQSDIFDRVISELQEGKKQSHWMWFIFPQIKGLSKSIMAQRYELSNIEQAKQYLNHPILGQRLRQCVELVLKIEHDDLNYIFGYPDNLKFISSMTLFNYVADEDDELFYKALDKFNQKNSDVETIRLIKQ